MPAWTDCAARRSHPPRSHRSDCPMRLRIPIRDDDRIGNIPTDETLPPVILPSPVPLEMRGHTHSTAPFTGHRILLQGFGTHSCDDRSSCIVCKSVSAAIEDSPSIGHLLFQGHLPIILFIGTFSRIGHLIIFATFTA